MIYSILGLALIVGLKKLSKQGGSQIRPLRRGNVYLKDPEGLIAQSVEELWSRQHTENPILSPSNFLFYGV